MTPDLDMILEGALAQVHSLELIVSCLRKYCLAIAMQLDE
jgi:hypothetical protein